MVGTSLPAVVRVVDLPAGTTVTGAELFEVVQTSAGVGQSVQLSLNQLNALVNIPTGGATGTILNKSSGANYSTQFSAINTFVNVGTSLATTGSATSIVAFVANQGITSTQIADNAVGTNQIASSLGIASSLSIGTLLTVGGTATFNGTAIFNSTAIFNGTTTFATSVFNNGIQVTGTSQFTGTFNVAGTSTITGNLGVIGTTLVTGTFGQVGTSLMTGAFGVVGTSLFTSGAFGVVGTATFTGSHSVVGTTLFTSGAFGIVGTTLITGTFGQVGTSLMTGAFGVSGTSLYTGLFTVLGTTAFTGGFNFSVLGTSTFTGAHFVNGTTLFTSGTFGVVGTTLFTSGTFGVVGTTLFTSGAFGVVGTTAFTSNVFGVVGTAILTGSLILASQSSGVANFLQVSATGVVGTTASAGNFVLLNTLSPNNVASTNDTSSFTSTYKNYMITFENVCPATQSSFLQMTFATSGSNFITGSYLSLVNMLSPQIIDTYTTALILTGIRATTGMIATTAYGFGGFIKLFNPAGTVARKQIVGEGTYIAATAAGGIGTASLFGVTINGLFDGNSNAVTGVNFSFNTGNIQTGTIKIYGMT